MSWYFLRPRQPLMSGDGRSWGGSFHRGSIFPPPQAVLGAARTRAGEVQGLDWTFNKKSTVVGTPDSPGSLHVLSVFYATRKQDGTVELFLPRPADLVVFPPPERSKEGTSWHPLRPTREQETEISPPHGLTRALSPLRHRDPAPRRKPAPDPPRFLGLNPFLAQLIQPSATPLKLEGERGPQSEDRVHVGIENVLLTAKDEILFSAGRLSFVDDLRTATIAGLVVELEGDAGNSLEGIWRLGGKGSLVEARAATSGLEKLDIVRRSALEKIESAEGRFRWTLLTPARFRRGWLPDFLDDRGEGRLGGAGVRLIAAAISRPLAWSGWDLAARGSSVGRGTGAPRPTRLFVPAGSVYFFETLNGGAPAARSAAESCWMQSVRDPSDETGDIPRRRAGAIDDACGLARGVFGPWNWYEEEA